MKNEATSNGFLYEFNCAFIDIGACIGRLHYYSTVMRSLLRGRKFNSKGRGYRESELNKTEGIGACSLDVSSHCGAIMPSV